MLIGEAIGRIVYKLSLRVDGRQLKKIITFKVKWRKEKR